MKKIDKIIIGTHNNGKFKEICDLLPENINKISPKDLNLPSPNEIGSTFKENSKIKAEYFAKKANLIAISDDSGLMIDLLSGAPGIYSSRWAGRKKDFSLAMNKIERKMRKVCDMRKKDRKAFFVCALSLYFPDHTYKVFEGKIHGHLQFPPKGANGFGYDPIFVPVGFSKTFGEMKYNFKEKISHRARAFQKLMQYLKKI